MLECLKALCAIPGVSGEEGRVRAFITAQIEGHCQYRVDALGNVLAFKEGRARPGKRLQLSAHMDEVGFIITRIEEEGLLRFAAVGGIDAAVVAGKPVRVGEKGLPGVVGLRPVHLLEKGEGDKPPKLEDLLIDIGAKDAEQARRLVCPGDRAVFESAFIPFGEGMLMGRALDDRAGCALLISLIQGELEYDCHFTFTVQEENGCVGGGTAAFGVEPDIAIAVETTTAGDIPEAPPHKQVCRLGGGPVLSFMDKGTIYDGALYAQAQEVAKEAGIPCQLKEGVYGGNESRSIQAARGGAQVLGVSLPCRYLHSPACVLCLRDLQDTRRLLAALAASFAR